MKKKRTNISRCIFYTIRCRPGITQKARANDSSARKNRLFSSLVFRLLSVKNDKKRIAPNGSPREEGVGWITDFVDKIAKTLSEQRKHREKRSR